jgi:hypothetical protein
VQHLRAQTIHQQLELIIVTVSAEQLQMEEAELADFAAFQLVDIGQFRSKAVANAAGARRARTPIVVFAEDHCFPEPRWAEALLRRHAGPWAAVGPVLSSANPRTTLSWCDFVVNYDPWIDPAPAGPTTFLPGHNVSYKRDLLRQFDDRLEDLLEVETVFHEQLLRQGHQLYLEPGARVTHVNFSRFIPWVQVLFHGGRIYAAIRAENWPFARRLSYGGAFPLIPFIRLWRILSSLRQAQYARPSVVRIAPVLLIGLACEGVGQAVGYLFGIGNAVRKAAAFEFNRSAYLVPEDRRTLLSTH